MKRISSYEENNYGAVFRAFILGQRPKVVVECGVLDGYSLFHIAHAVRFNKRFGVNGKVFAYDLWDDYKYKHGSYGKVQEMIRNQMLEDEIDLEISDAFDASNNHPNGTVDFLHMDISNNGDILLKTIEVWGDKISPNGMIAFEGGSEERDNIKWMKKYGKKPIRDILLNDVWDKWNIQIFKLFPSLTLLWKRS
jgi:hypothetical protein